MKLTIPAGETMKIPQAVHRKALALYLVSGNAVWGWTPNVSEDDTLGSESLGSTDYSKTGAITLGTGGGATFAAEAAGSELLDDATFAADDTENNWTVGTETGHWVIAGDGDLVLANSGAHEVYQDVTLPAGKYRLQVIAASGEMDPGETLDIGYMTGFSGAGAATRNVLAQLEDDITGTSTSYFILTQATTVRIFLARPTGAGDIVSALTISSVSVKLMAELEQEYWQDLSLAKGEYSITFVAGTGTVDDDSELLLGLRTGPDPSTAQRVVLRTRTGAISGTFTHRFLHPGGPLRVFVRKTVSVDTHLAGNLVMTSISLKPLATSAGIPLPAESTFTMAGSDDGFPFASPVYLKASSGGPAVVIAQMLY